jgi:hypothetical protein
VGERWRTEWEHGAQTWTVMEAPGARSVDPLRQALLARLQGVEVPLATRDVVVALQGQTHDTRHATGTHAHKKPTIIHPAHPMKRTEWGGGQSTQPNTPTIAALQQLALQSPPATQRPQSHPPHQRNNMETGRNKIAGPRTSRKQALKSRISNPQRSAGDSMVGCQTQGCGEQQPRPAVASPRRKL